MQITFNLKDKQDCLLAMKMIGDFHDLEHSGNEAAAEPSSQSPETPSEPQHTIQDLRQMAKAYMGKDADKRAKVKALLEEMEIKGGISKTPPEKIDLFADKLKALAE